MGHAAPLISVLLVEDEVLVSNMIADSLTASGFAVHEVTSADEALHYIKSGARVDILFTDVNLPGGMSSPTSLATATARARST